jgi:tRNA dimethylallyltransferase
MTRPPALFVLGGPTATGKSALAIEVARRFDAVVVSADAMTVYQGLDVGTAKPTEAERAATPHFCIDVLPLDGDYSVADFTAEVRRVLAEHPRVVVAGGTPFYLRAIVDPLSPLPPADPAVRARLEAVPDLHERLQRLDPHSAERLHPNDRVRLIRALEVLELTGETLTALHARAGAPALAQAVTWIDRGDLRTRIDRRIADMLAQGYIDEVAWAVEQAGDRDLRPLRSFSYRHLVAHVRGELDRDEALRCTARDTWRFARKQRTFARGRGWSPVDLDHGLRCAAAIFGG